MVLEKVVLRVRRNGSILVGLLHPKRAPMLIADAVLGFWLSLIASFHTPDGLKEMTFRTHSYHTLEFCEVWQATS